MASTIQIRVDDDLKIKSDALFKDLGTDTTTAIRIFLTQAVAQNGFPFEIKRHTSVKNPFSYMTEDELMAKWVGRAISKDEASEVSGIKSTKYLDEFDSTISSYISFVAVLVNKQSFR